MNARSIVGSLVVGLALVGCSPTDGDVDEIDTLSDEQLALSLFIDTARNANGELNGRFGVGESIFTFQTRRTSEAEAAVIQENGGVPVAVRLLDGRGETVAVSTPSHALPEGWEPVAPEFLSDADLSRRVKVAKAVARLGAIIRSARMPADSEPERKALENASTLVPEEGDYVRNDAPAPAASSDVSTLATSWRQLFSIYKKSLVVIAEHSGTRWRNYYYSGGWKFYNTVQYCNHGACPGDSSMSLKCAKYNSAGGYIGSSKSCDSFGSGYNVCGLWGHNHNCHDDSKVQRARVLGRSGLSSEPNWCDSSGCDGHAPSC